MREKIELGMPDDVEHCSCAFCAGLSDAYRRVALALMPPPVFPAAVPAAHGRARNARR
jgi:hypothetical protein